MVTVIGRLGALEGEAGPWEHRSQVLPFGLQPGTHVEEISERGAKREANLGLEERRGEVHPLPDKLLVFNTWPIGEEGNTWARTKKSRKFSWTDRDFPREFPQLILYPVFGSPNWESLNPPLFPFPLVFNSSPHFTT